MFSKRKILASFFTAALLVVGLSGAENSAVVSDTTSNWSSSENVRSGNLTSASWNFESATNLNTRSQEYAVRDIVYPKFRSDITWFEWIGGNTERVSHIALRRHPDIPRSNVRFHVNSVDVVELWPGSRDFAANFSWQLYNLRGYSGNWDSCSTGNIGAIRSYDSNPSTGAILMATGNTMTGRTLRNNPSANNYLTNFFTSGASTVNRDANLCLIITEKTGTNYRFSNLGRCMYFEFNINLTSRVDVPDGTTSWTQPLTITTEMLNMSHPNQYTPQNCAVG